MQKKYAWIRRASDMQNPLQKEETSSWFVVNEPSTIPPKLFFLSSERGGIYPFIIHAGAGFFMSMPLRFEKFLKPSQDFNCFKPKKSLTFTFVTVCELPLSLTAMTAFNLFLQLSAEHKGFKNVYERFKKGMKSYFVEMLFNNIYIQ